MPGVNGLEAARAIGKRAHIVFVTAFDQYAVEAFEQGAIDYVLKPFNEERLSTTVERLKERLGGEPPVLEQLLSDLTSRLGPPLLGAPALDQGLGRPERAPDPGGGGALLPVGREIHPRGHRATPRP